MEDITLMWTHRSWNLLSASTKQLETQIFKTCPFHVHIQICEVNYFILHSGFVRVVSFIFIFSEQIFSSNTVMMIYALYKFRFEREIQIFVFLHKFRVNIRVFLCVDGDEDSDVWDFVCFYCFKLAQVKKLQCSTIKRTRTDQKRMS